MFFFKCFFWFMFFSCDVGVLFVCFFLFCCFFVVVFLFFVFLVVVGKVA